MQDLIWHRDADNVRRVETQGASEFSATVSKQGGEWVADVLTFGLPLTSRRFRTLAEARANVESAWHAVEPACAG